MAKWRDTALEAKLIGNLDGAVIIPIILLFVPPHIMTKVIFILVCIVFFIFMSIRQIKPSLLVKLCREKLAGKRRVLNPGLNHGKRIEMRMNGWNV